MSDWWIYKGTGEPHNDIDTRLPEPPRWRDFIDRDRSERIRGEVFQADDRDKDLVNAALYLRRPLLITGKPGNGKSSLAYAVAHELNLGPVLRWPITTRSTLAEGLYRYDAIRRVEEASLTSSVKDEAAAKKAVQDIGRYLRLGPLGTALLPGRRPRVLLIDEIDKSDIDLPNDLLNIFEEGEFEIPELTRFFQERELEEEQEGDEEEQERNSVWVMPYDGEKDSDRVQIKSGRVRCSAFPFVVLTSNDEREFPAAFLRRCLRLNIDYPNPEKLANIVEAHFYARPKQGEEQSRPEPSEEEKAAMQKIIDDFLNRRKKADLATDQLLNALYLASSGVGLYNERKDKDKLIDAILRYLTARG